MLDLFFQFIVVIGIGGTCIGLGIISGSLIKNGYKKVMAAINYNRRVDPIWSDTVNILMDQEPEIKEEGDWMLLGPAKFWARDWPSSYGELHGTNQLLDKRTQRRLRDYVTMKKSLRYFEQMQTKQSIQPAEKSTAVNSQVLVFATNSAKNSDLG